MTRLADRGPYTIASGKLFNGPEIQQLTQLFEAVVATGVGLGKYRVRERMVKAQAAGGLHRFAESDEIPFASIQVQSASDPFLFIPPHAAIQYFQSLIPRLGKDPVRWFPALQRTSMTLAAATENELVERVQARILDKLKSGEEFSKAPRDIEALLDDVGVTPNNPQYAQMVFRTNTMDAYNVGLQLELEEPDAKEFFPVWKYLGIRDGREGADHRPKFGRYFPNSLPFALVRGKRVFNCRCTPVPIDKYQWAQLKAQGATLSTLAEVGESLAA